ncbi:MAG: DUF2007 domain-containing protein [Bacteroidota bacterium]|nr:MAG: DUF2007 domain-containing protein [Bacteroidota bacterium]
MLKNENWLLILTFVYPHEAHFAKAFLESEGIESEIRDELTAQMNNFYSNAIGGVKLMVREADFNSGIEALKKGGYINETIVNEADKIEIVFVEKGFNINICPYCKSENISIKKVPNIWTVIVIFLFNAVFPIFKKSYKCYECEKEWKYQKK